MGRFVCQIISSGSRVAKASRRTHLPHLAPRCSLTFSSGLIERAKSIKSLSRKGCFTSTPRWAPSRLDEKHIFSESRGRYSFRSKSNI